MFWKRSAKLLPAQRDWILINALGATALINLLVNSGLGFLSTIGVARVPLLAAPVVGGPSTITATIGTLLLLPLITSLLTTAVVRHELRAGRLSPVPAAALPGLLRRLPHGGPARGRVLAGACTALLGPPAVLLIAGLGFGGISPINFIVYGDCLAVALGAIVTPVIALHAMAEHRPAGPAG